MININVSEFIKIHNSALRSAVKCVQQAYQSVKSVIRRIKTIVKKNEIKEKKINNERIAIIQMKNRVSVKRTRTFCSKGRNE